MEYQVLTQQSETQHTSNNFLFLKFLKTINNNFDL